MGTSGLEAAILDFPLPVWSYSISVNSIGMLDPENIGIVFEILFLSLIGAEIYRRGVVATHSLGTSLFAIQIHEGTKIYRDFCTRKFGNELPRGVRSVFEKKPQGK